MKLRQWLRKTPGVVAAVRLGRQATAIIRGSRRRRSVVRAISAGALVLPDSGNRFAGYYDHSPFQPGNESLILVHMTRHQAWRRPSPVIPVYIQLVDWQEKTVVQELGTSQAWNWQQGARAMWMDADTVIYNVYDDYANRYRARLVGADGKVKDELPIPVQEVDGLGRVYSLSYEALARIRPDYGYRNHSIHEQDLNNNALEQYNPATGQHRILVQISSLQHDAKRRYGCKVEKAKLNHVMSSPDDRHLAFLFRYFVRGRRVTDFYTVNVESSECRLLVGDGAVSHACWWDKETLLVTMKGPTGFGYHLVYLSEGTIEAVWHHPDGHPNYLDADHFLTDTYPDRYSLRSLLVRSMYDDKLTELAAFPEPLLLQGETRCDLHPSLSPSGRWIQVDCTVGHRRTVVVLPNPLFDCEGVE